METNRKWTKIKDQKPEIDTEVHLLWMHPLMRGHTETGYLMRRHNGDIVWRYTFCGALEPDYWTPVIPLPPIPET